MSFRHRRNKPFERTVLTRQITTSVLTTTKTIEQRTPLPRVTIVHYLVSSNGSWSVQFGRWKEQQRHQADRNRSNSQSSGRTIDDWQITTSIATNLTFLTWLRERHLNVRISVDRYLWWRHFGQSSIQSAMSTNSMMAIQCQSFFFSLNVSFSNGALRWRWAETVFFVKNCVTDGSPQMTVIQLWACMPARQYIRTEMCVRIVKHNKLYNRVMWRIGEGEPNENLYALKKTIVFVWSWCKSKTHCRISMFNSSSLKHEERSFI